MMTEYGEECTSINRRRAEEIVNNSVENNRNLATTIAVKPMNETNYFFISPDYASPSDNTADLVKKLMSNV
jgi:hypothetical protein